MTPETATAEVTEVAPEDVAKQLQRTRQAERDVRHAQRKRQAVELKRSGFTFQEIGQALEISGEAARKLYRSALKDFYRKAAEEEKETALLRCDGIIKRWWPKLLSEDNEVADLATKNLFRAMNFQADLWGMKHTKVDVNVTGEVKVPSTGNELWTILEEFRQAALRGERDPAEPPSMAELQPAAQSNGSEPIEVIAHTNGHKPPGETP